MVRVHKVLLCEILVSNRAESNSFIQVMGGIKLLFLLKSFSHSAILLLN